MGRYQSDDEPLGATADGGLGQGTRSGFIERATFQHAGATPPTLVGIPTMMANNETVALKD